MQQYFHEKVHQFIVEDSTSKLQKKIWVSQIFQKNNENISLGSALASSGCVILKKVLFYTDQELFRLIKYIYFLDSTPFLDTGRAEIREKISSFFGKMLRRQNFLTFNECNYLQKLRGIVRIDMLLENFFDFIVLFCSALCTAL